MFFNRKKIADEKKKIADAEVRIHRTQTTKAINEALNSGERVKGLLIQNGFHLEIYAAVGGTTHHD